MVLPFQHDRLLENAEELLDATANGQHLGMTEAETRTFVAEAKKKKQECCLLFVQTIRAQILTD